MANMSVNLAERSWEMVNQNPLVLIPTGSTEQHGPHLPLETDSVIAATVAKGVAERLKASSLVVDVVIAPTITFGASGEHQGFAGTTSIGQDVLQSLIIEVVRSMSLWAGRVIFVNAHGGNVRALELAVSQMIAENHDVAWVPCSTVGGDSHAGRTETSLMLHIAPTSVDLGRAVIGNTDSLRSLLPALGQSGVQAVSASGILGDPTGASAADGAALLDAMITDVTQRLSHAVVNDRGCLVRPGVNDVVATK
jgi:mycofactocin system creatininase family protein